MSVNVNTIRADWQRRHFSCDVWTDPPGQVWTDYVHDTDELLMLIEGKIELHFNGQIHQPAIGEEILIPAGAKHTVINVGHTVNRWLYGYKRD